MLFNSFVPLLVSGALAALSTVLSWATSLPAIEIVGNKFFYPNGSQFYIKGIAYQADSANSTAEDLFTDPLADGSACKRDVKYLTDAYTNVIRVYAVNTSLDHSECLETFAKAGIYIIADLAEPDLSINRDSPQWNIDLFKRYTSVVDMFANYTNVLGFFAGNEVTNNNTNTAASAFVKAAIRDTKAYIKSQGYRLIPVGYLSNDDADTRVPMADYFACGSTAEAADFYGINMYEWCGDLSYTASGYSDRTDEFKNLSIPIFFSEYGCNTKGTRQFAEVQSLYGSDMDSVWSGGIVYMYFEEANDYGLVLINGDSVSTLADYLNLKLQLAKVLPSSAKSADQSTTTGTFACPATDSNWMAATSLPPTPNEDTCNCVYNALKCVVDLSVEEENYSDLFSYVCNEIDCSEISTNGTTGKYGKYSFCLTKDQLSYVLNAYYLKQGGSKSACDFSGSASLKSATSGSCLVATGSSSSHGSKSLASSSSSSSSGSGSKSSSSSKSNANKVYGGSVIFSKMELAVAAFLVASFAGGASLVF